MTNPPNDSQAIDAEGEQLDWVLITLYKTAMIHGEAQANGVLPTPDQRELTIVLAKSRVMQWHRKALHEAEIRARIDELEQRKTDYKGYLPRGSNNPYATQNCIPEAYIDGRIRELQAMLGADTTKKEEL